MIRLRPSGADEVLIKRVRDWYEPGPGVFFTGVTGTASFSPAMLFTGSTTGVWYDPSDMTTLFQDAAGTTPVTAMEQPVGKMLDKSGRGNHATQSTAGNRPTLSARYNLYVNTETLATQSVTTVATSYKLTFTGSGSITLSGTATGVYTSGSYTIACTAGTLISTVLGNVAQADLRVANDALNQPAYQRVGNVAVTSSDYDTVGFKPYLKFNGISSFMATGSIDFTNTAQMFVSAGVRKLSDATLQFPVELSSSVNTQNGSFAIVTSSAVPYKYAFASRGSITVDPYTNNSAYSAPVTNVLSGISDIDGVPDQAILRVNSTQAAISTADQGNGPYGTYPIYIGARAGSLSWFNGRLYQLVVAGKQASASEITNTETYVNQKTGAY